MKLSPQSNRIFFAVSFLTTVTACSHGPAVQEFADTASPREEVTKFETDMSAAGVAQVDILAPHNFKGAQEALADSKKSLDKQKDAKVILHEVAEGRAYLNRANELAQLSHTNMEEVVTARSQALTVGANQAFATEFRAADETLRDVTSDLEKNELKSAAENRTTIQAAYLELELAAIKQNNLGPSRDKVAQAVKDGARDFAPRSLAIAEKSIKDTDSFITANRHENDKLKLRSAETLASADHLLKITHESKAGKQTSSEDTALQMETEKTRVQDGNLALVGKQTQLDSKQTQLDSKQSQLTEEQGTTNALTAKNKSLESDQAFNRSFEDARAEFTSNEAEVYKQGNTLMIRLRGLEFPVAQAVLKGSNFPLLAKVQKVIKEFGKSSVIIEGHTDSIGGKATNEKLSSDRAQAVKEYLMSNAGDAPVTITAIGYGYQKPLATNKTSSGRAQNRRVDILIQPEKNAQM